LLLDESTSSLDSESEHAVQQALQRLMRGRTVVIVAHRLSTVRDADTIFVVDAGVVAAAGPHERLMAHSPLYANLVRRQLMAASTLAVDETEAAVASAAIIPGGSPATADAPVRVDVAPVTSRPHVTPPPALSTAAHVELSVVPIRRAPVNRVSDAAPDNESGSHQLLQRNQNVSLSPQRVVGHSTLSSA
jgi:ABC-type glutathione transport system ATPase component